MSCVIWGKSLFRDSIFFFGRLGQSFSKTFLLPPSPQWNIFFKLSLTWKQIKVEWLCWSGEGSYPPDPASMLRKPLRRSPIPLGLAQFSMTRLPTKDLKWTFLELASNQPIKNQPKWQHQTRFPEGQTSLPGFLATKIKACCPWQDEKKMLFETWEKIFNWVQPLFSTVMQ